MNILRLWLLLGTIGLTGCATAPGIGTPPSVPQDTEAYPAVPVLQLDDEARPGEMLPAQSLDEDILYQLLLAELSINAKQYDQAASIYLSLARKIQDPRLVRRSAQVSLLASDPSFLSEAARLWLALDGNDIDAWQIMTVARIREGDVAGAVRALERADSPSEVALSQRYRWLTSLVPASRQAMTVTAEVFKRYSERQVDNEAASFAYAHVLSRLGRVDEAMKVIDAVLGKHPDLHDAIVMKVRLLQSLGQRAEAQEVLSQAIARLPDDQDLRLIQARLFMEDQRYEAAVRSFEALLHDRPNDSEIIYALAVLNLQLQRLDQSEAYLKRLEAMGRHREEVAFYLGWLAEKRNEPALAMRYYAAVTQGANYLDAQIRRAVLMAGQGDLAGARKLLNDLHKQMPSQEKRLLLVEAELLANAQRPEEALALYATGLETFPGDIDVLYARAMLAERLGRLDDFERDMQSILAKDPDNVSALNALGYTLADKTHRYEEAYRYIKKAYELSPDNNAILDSMGWVLYKLGRGEEATAFLRRSLKMQMDNEVAAHLGEVLWVNGDREQARTVWQKGLEQFPDDPILRATMHRLGAETE